LVLLLCTNIWHRTYTNSQQKTKIVNQIPTLAKREFGKMTVKFNLTNFKNSKLFAVSSLNTMSILLSF
jgi:hypothetical protein